MVLYKPTTMETHFEIIIPHNSSMQLLSGCRNTIATAAAIAMSVTISRSLLYSKAKPEDIVRATTTNQCTCTMRSKPTIITNSKLRMNNNDSCIGWQFEIVPTNTRDPRQRSSPCQTLAMLCCRVSNWRFRMAMGWLAPEWRDCEVDAHQLVRVYLGITGIHLQLIDVNWVYKPTYNCKPSPRRKPRKPLPQDEIQYETSFFLGDVYWKKPFHA